MVTLKDARKKKPRSSSPSRPRASTLSPSASPLDGDQVESTAVDLFDDLQISQNYPDSSSNPRSFPYSVKQQCWDKAEKVKGRDPDRWRRDFVGNILFRKLVGCPGCLCHDYDHIVPYSKVSLLNLVDLRLPIRLCLLHTVCIFHESLLYLRSLIPASSKCCIRLSMRELNFLHYTFRT